MNTKAEEDLKKEVAEWLNLEEVIRESNASIRRQKSEVEQLETTRANLTTRLLGYVGPNLTRRYVIVDKKLIRIDHQGGVVLEKDVLL